MPRWDLHLACGISVTVLYSFCAIFPLIDVPDRPWSAFGIVILPLSVGAFSLLLGSILPDIDGKGRIRWIIGPVIGSLALALMTVRAGAEGGIGGSLQYLSDDGSLLFLAATVAGYGILLLPMRHRGIMHRVPSALVYSALCAGAFVLALDQGAIQGGVVGAMAFSGYGWHLALDGSA